MQTSTGNNVIVMHNGVQKQAIALESQLAASQEPVFPDALALLNQQFDRIYVELEPARQDYEAREAAVNFLNDLFRNKLSVGDLMGQYGVCYVRPFGSFTMNMFTSTSDLDLSLNVSAGFNPASREQRIQILKKLLKVLRRLEDCGVVQEIQPIFRAKVPVVKFLHCNTGIECDISVENRDGIIKSQLLRNFSHIDPRFRKLCFLVKAWANASGINSSKHHTLNSLSIILLVAFHLQTRMPPVLPPFNVLLEGYNLSTSNGIAMVENQARRFVGFGFPNKDTIGQLFRSFLIQIMAVKDMWQQGLCASTYQGTWMKASEPGLIFVQDFSALSENAARGVDLGGFQSIYTCFQEAHQCLKGYVVGTFKPRSLRSLLFTPDTRATTNKKAPNDVVIKEHSVHRVEPFNHFLRHQNAEALTYERAFWLAQNNLPPNINPQMRKKHIMAEVSHSGEHPSKRLRLIGDSYLNSLMHPRYQGVFSQGHPSQINSVCEREAGSLHGRGRVPIFQDRFSDEGLIAGTNGGVVRRDISHMFGREANGLHGRQQEMNSQMYHSHPFGHRMH